MEKATLKGYRVDIDFVNCNPNIKTINENPIGGKLNFYYPHCKDGVTGLKQYNKVTYQNLYHNIDAIYYGGKAQGLKYDLVVKPGGNPKDIQLKYAGADNISLVNGKIQVKTALGNIQEWMPKVYQNINGKEVKIKAEYVLTKPSSKLNGSAPSPLGRDGVGLLSFNVGTYNPNYPLIIDPWITYYGGSGSDEGNSIANDNLGNVLVTGQTQSSPFPTSAGAFQIAYAGVADAFVLSMSPNGITRNFATYFGGTAYDEGNGICSDASNNIIFCGQTTSTDIACSATGTNVVLQNTVAASGDRGFLVKLNTAGVLQFATYYNGQMTDVCSDALDNIIAYGLTSNLVNVATVVAIQTTFAGIKDAFVVKFNNNGSRIWGTYFGGGGADISSGVCVDRNTNDIYFTGLTQSTDYTVTAGAHQTTYGGGVNDAFLTKLSPTGNLVWSTFYGGIGNDRGYAICTDQLGYVMIGGETSTPTSSAIRTIGAGFAGGLADAFIAKFNSAGIRQWGTYLGGNNLDYCTGLACDANNNIIAGGDSYSNNLPVTSCAFQTTRKGVEDNWLGTFSPTGSIICLGYLGKPGPFETETSPGLGGSISVFAYQSHIVGYSGGQWPVTVGAYQTAYAGGFNDVDIAQLDISSCSIPSSNSNIVASTGCNCNGSVTVSLTATCVTPPYSYYYSNGAQTLNTAAQSNSLTNLCAGVYGYTVVPTSGGSIFGSFSIGGTTSTPTLVISPNSTICIGQSTTLTASGGSTYTWTASNGSNPPNSFSVIVTPTISTTYTVLSGTGTCTAHAISDVSVIPSITVVVSPTNYSICSVGLGVNITATGATSYTWSPSAGLSSIAGSLVTASPTLTTIYNVNGSAGSCNSSLNVTVTVKPSPAVSFSLQPDPTPHFWNIYPTYSGGTQPYSFSWNWGDGSPNDNTAYPSHTYSVAGTYSICIAITDANGCTASYCLNNSVYRLDHTNTMIYINVVNTVTGIKQNANLATLISINPNPANELFKIETNLIGIKTVELFDMNGKLVLSNPITNNGSINVAELSEGLYILTIKLANNVINKKVVIVR